MQEEYYLNKLYPLQDKVLQIIDKQNRGFYLTGGTALSRFYLNHRYSDDLDFFMNNISDFKTRLLLLINVLKNEFHDGVELGLLDDSFSRILIKTFNCELKLDFVNDVPFHFGNMNLFPLFSSVDNPINILSNKLSALPRNSPKDIADILFLSRNYSFNWVDIINAAKEKDLWVNPLDSSSIIETFPIELFNEINWVQSIDMNSSKEDIKIIAKDIILGIDNSLKR